MELKSFPKKENLLIFDIDGTLTDSVFIHQAGFRKALKNSGITKYDNNFSGYQHHTDSFIFKTIFESNQNCPCTETDIMNFNHALYQEIQKEIDGKSIAEIDGALKFVNYILFETDFALVYATGSLEKPALLKLEHTGFPLKDSLLVCSDKLQTREEIVEASMKKAMGYFGNERFNKVIALGDGLWDLQTAKSANLGFIGIGAKNKQILYDHGASVVFDNFIDFKAVVSCLNTTCAISS
ncbi:MAG: HAD family hydrolase [Sporocytophaga sp.]|uniref:HAD family hydrolase n=1 Tax=Sporocytophaga sp. TaxID=2231183 RepID=UPI001B026C89|nr:HAD hydrolase-like protein [Sporocytophaga sp.]MBO9701217.1 HAD family hydrolase [Sporocytophaga sp.]